MGHVATHVRPIVTIETAHAVETARRFELVVGRDGDLAATHSVFCMGAVPVAVPLLRISP